MPYETEHACRLMYPGDFESFRSKDSGKARLILGKRKGSSEWEVQAIRYPKEQWPEEMAKQSCMSNDGMFEAAVKVGEMSEGGPIPEFDPAVDGPLPAEAVRFFSDRIECQAKKYASTLYGVELFAAGTWKGDTYTESDLDAMVSASRSLPIVPPVKLGHAEAQKFFAQADGHPALGWVTNLRRKGKKLLGDLTDIPDALTGLIRERRYRKLSSEVYWNYKDDGGATYPRVLKAVALLGAELPAVAGLADLQTALMSDSGREARRYSGEANGEAEVRVYGDDTEDTGMEQAQMEQKIAALTAENDSLKKDLAEARLDAALKVFSLEVEGLVKEGKVLPKEVAGLMADFREMGTAVRKYGEKEQTWGARKVEELKARPKLVEFGEKAAGDEGKGDGEGSMPAHAVVDQQVRVFMAENPGKSYDDGMNIIRQKDPALWGRYLRNE